MELLHYLMNISAGAELAGATLMGRGGRLVIAAAAAVVSLALPDGIDSVLMMMEMLVARRLV